MAGAHPDSLCAALARVCLRSGGNSKIAYGRYTKLDFEGILVSLRPASEGNALFRRSSTRSVDDLVQAVGMSGNLRRRAMNSHRSRQAARRAARRRQSLTDRLS